MKFLTAMNMTLLFVLLSACTEEEAATNAVHYDNPFTVAKQWYVDPVWSDNVNSEMDGELVAGESTAVWLNRNTDLRDWNGQTALSGYNLHDHLDEALEQGSDLMVLVLNNIPGTNCWEPPSSSELPVSTAAMVEYKEEYIDYLVAILAEPQYSGISFVAIVGPSSWHHLVINPDNCEIVSNERPWGMTESIRYALTELSVLPNVHSYLGVSDSSTLGWTADFEASTMFLAGIIEGFDDKDGHALGAEIEAGDRSTGKYTALGHTMVESVGDTPPPGWGAISGFVSNVRGYIPLEEPYLGDAESDVVGGDPLRSALFYDWNPIFSELEYAENWLEAMQEYGGGDALGMLIDTSRNGWGGPNRPTEDDILLSGNASDIVDRSRVDRRPHRQSWCNQDGAGLGERPQPSPALKNSKAFVHAYVWAKEPGVSDGVSDPNFTIDRNDLEATYSEMCDPDGDNQYAEDAAATSGKGIATGAMVNSPHSRRWFSESFQQLLNNAWPPL